VWLAIGGGQRLAVHQVCPGPSTAHLTSACRAARTGAARSPRSVSCCRNATDMQRAVLLSVTVVGR
jgi:hypothetical protein